MNTEHTPGPWRVDYAQGIIAANGTAVAYVEADHSDTPSPDARLIAAAPDLLAALKQVVEDGCATVYAHGYDEAGAMGCCGELTYRPHAESCWMVRARAAIAKAEGKA